MQMGPGFEHMVSIGNGNNDALQGMPANVGNVFNANRVWLTGRDAVEQFLMHKGYTLA